MKHSQLAPAIAAALTAEPILTIDAGKPAHDVPPLFFGIMTEEINHSWDGGIYAELIQNRIFKDAANDPVHWSAIQRGEGQASISLDETQPINNTALTTCLKLDAQGGGGIANGGFWGIPVKPETTYRASFFGKTNSNPGGPITVSIESNDGHTVFATAEVPKLTGEWQRYEVTLTTPKDAKPSASNRFVISTPATGTFWFNLLSLFPPTFNNRPNGNRIDLMQLLAGLKPRFMRLPGGAYVQGKTFEERFKWKESLGDLSQRPGNPGYWHYRASDGLGLLEMLEWCEDLGMEPVLAVNSGYARPSKHPTGFHVTGTELQPYIDEALDEIEYIIGDPATKWGARRAQDGHPAPFKLTYVEIGNEDGADVSGSYESRYVPFHDAIKAKYPNLQLISTVGGIGDEWAKRFTVTQRKPDLLDEHYYRNSGNMQEAATQFDNYDRNGPKIIVGEWATREGEPTTNFSSALGDAAFMTGMERNSDIVLMHCYAPIFVSVDEGASQWPCDLIGFNVLTSYGSPSYYAQKMFSEYLGDKVLPVKGDNIPIRTWQSPKAEGREEQPPPKELPSLFYCATRDYQTGAIYLKVVHTAAAEQTVRIEIKGAEIAPEGASVVLTAAQPGDTNSITEPTKIIPETASVSGLGNSFTYRFAPYSINVLKLLRQR